MVKSTLLVFSLFICTLGARPASLRDGSIHPVWITPPASLAQGSEGLATLGVDNAGSTDTVIALSSSDTTQITVPSSVTIPAGQTQVEFNVTATATAIAGATVTGTANAEHATSATILISPGN